MAAQRHRARVRGAIRAVTRPTTLRSLTQRFGFMESLVYGARRRGLRDAFPAGGDCLAVRP
jgi:hypothetical protein